MPVEKRLAEISALVGGTVHGDENVVIRGAASFEEAREGEITFVSDKKYLKNIGKCRASALIVSNPAAGSGNRALNLLIVKNPMLAFAKLMGVFKPISLPPAGISPAASVHPKAVIGKGVSVQPFAVVEEGARVGDGAVLYAGAFVGRGATIGAGTILYQGAVVREECVVGDRVIIHCNSVIGSDGFGYTQDAGRYVKIPQQGIVRIEDDVEIGACVTIDRATLGETVIGRGTKIDNLVQVAHNVRIGADTVIVAQVGIAGSAHVGSRVQIGGQVGLAGHIEIGDDVMIGAQSGVTNDVAPKSVVSGYPAIPHTEWLRAAASFEKLPEMRKKLSELEKRLAALETGDTGAKKG